MASNTSRSGRALGGFRYTRRMALRAAGIADSPSAWLPSRNSAHRTMLSVVAGSTWPRMARTRLASRTADTRSPATPVMLARNRLPKECPCKSPRSNRYSNSRVMRGSASARATRQSLMSPGGSTPSSRRSRPELPPSSNTVTTAVTETPYRLSPRSRVDRPVPPPTATIRGPLPRARRCTMSSASRWSPRGRNTVATDRTVARTPRNTQYRPPTTSPAPVTSNPQVSPPEIHELNHTTPYRTRRIPTDTTSASSTAPRATQNTPRNTRAT